MRDGLSEGTLLRVAMVGCGLIAENQHLPAIARSGRARLSLLVDRAERVAEVRELLSLSCAVSDSWRGLRDRAEAAIVAVPNSLHAEVAGALLNEGVHVLCEKPMALTSDDGRQLCDVAEKRGVTLAVGYVTRFHHSTNLLKDAIDNQLIGNVTKYDLEFGVRFKWPAVSAFYFDRKQAGGGVLMSEAIHTLDRLLYWFGDVDTVECVDNNQGGVETDATLMLTHCCAGRKIVGRARFSWLGALRNTLEVQGTEGRAFFEKDNRMSIQVDRVINGRLVRFHVGDRRQMFTAEDYFAMQFEDFVDSIQTGRSPRVSGPEGVKSVALLERAYRCATHAKPAWAAVTT